MPRKLPNFIHGAIYRSKSGQPDASVSAPRFNCYMPARADIPPDAYVADCRVCDRFGRINPGLNVHPFRFEKRTSAASSTPKARRNDGSVPYRDEHLPTR